MYYHVIFILNRYYNFGICQSLKLQIHYRLARQATDQAAAIRHQLADVENSLRILQQLQLVYVDTDNNKQQLSESWIKKLSNQELSDWPRLLSDFDTYPMMR